LDDVPAQTGLDHRVAAGWDALGWAERIAPGHWGSATEADAWVRSVRCLTLAAVVTGRTSACPHTVGPTLTGPVVAVVRAPGVFRCPPCAEPLVAQLATGGACDRCGSVAVAVADRVAVLAGSALIVVGQLCGSCRSQVFALLNGAELA
jgi:hypothetical protein